MPMPKKFKEGVKISLQVPKMVKDYYDDHPEVDKSEVFLLGHNLHKPKNVSPSKARQEELKRDLDRLTHEKDEELYKINLKFDDEIRKIDKEISSLDDLIQLEETELINLWKKWREEKASQWGRSPPPTYQGSHLVDEFWRQNNRPLTRDWIFQNWKEMDGKAWPEKLPDWYNLRSIRSSKNKSSVEELFRDD